MTYTPQHMTPGEAAMVKATVAAMEQRGYSLTHVWDGGEFVKTPTLDECLAAVDSVSESVIHVRKLDADPLTHHSSRVAFFVVLGNDPTGEEVIADHSGVSDVEDATREAWEEVSRWLITADGITAGL